MKKIRIKTLLFSIAAAELTGVLSALLAGGQRAVYQALRQPPFSPPAWVFPVVWTILYALMGTAAYLVFRSEASAKEKKNALVLYAIQLALNFLWSIVFFRFEAFWLAVAVIAALTVVLILTVIQFYTIDKTAAVLMLPYLVWVLFAAYLNIGIAVLN